MSDESDVLGVNAAFYEAFSRRDLVAVQRLWAPEGALTCIHPGWDALRGRAEVLASFRAIIEGPSSPRIRCSDATAEVFGETAIVICCESIDAEGEGGARSSSPDLVATNVFVRVSGAWRLIHHHAGPLSARRVRTPPPAPARKKSDLN